jgi:hypothetical protein
MRESSIALAIVSGALLAMVAAAFVLTLMGAYQ